MPLIIYIKGIFNYICIALGNLITHHHKKPDTMKKTITLFFILLFSFQSEAQRWFPVGATFTFTQQFWEFPYNQKPAEWKVSDTVTIKHKLCQKLVMSKGAKYGVDTNDFVMFVYDSNSVVYWYRTQLDSFTVLYDFNKNEGETWEIFGIKSIRPFDSVECTLVVEVKKKDTVVINGYSLRTMEIEIINGLSIGYAGGYDGTIVEFVGHQSRPRPDPFHSCHSSSESGDFFGIRCFDHPDIGFHDYKIVPYCDYVTSSIDEFNAQQDFIISPNPSTDFFDIKYQNKNRAVASISVSNIVGQQVLLQKLSEGNNKINSRDWTTGVYIFQIVQEGKIVAKGKLLKQ